ncbi:hypothetical protein D3C87_1852260 [compost metagenome]
MQADIAGHRNDAQHIELFGRGEGEKDRHGIVLAGVGIDNDLAGHGNFRRLGRYLAGTLSNCVRRVDGAGQRRMAGVWKGAFRRHVCRAGGGTKAVGWTFPVTSPPWIKTCVAPMPAHRLWM